ncbi:acyl-protein synthetase [Megasphaera sueciensis]|uniref:LuxE/PaaK family acyltransferase n=1 Tax=Megasphaera sueciensis TaxID=349094 RepID=UPI003D067A13
MDYSEWLSHEPYSWSQKEKEAHYLPYFKELTAYHRLHCPSYGKVLDMLAYEQHTVKSIDQIPMLPISLFKQMSLKSIPDDEIFKTLVSSGTTGQAVSKIFLDKVTAQNQQLTLLKIVTSFLDKSRLPMLIIDTPSTLKSREKFTARGAAILGFSIFAKHRYYALDDTMHVNIEVLKECLKKSAGKPILIFGFTFMIWKYFCQALEKAHMSFDFSNAFVLHGGGWKKMQDQAVSPTIFRKKLLEQFGISHVHNYYGMAEQTGCIYMECEYGHLHASIFSDIIMRKAADFSVCPIGIPGIIQVLSPMAVSYPGHSLLTEDIGTLLGIDDCPCGRKGKYFSVDGRIPAAEIRGCSDTYGQ